MDLFEIPEDYKPEHQMTEEEMKETTEYLLNHPLFMKELPADIESNPHLMALQNIIYDEEPEKLAESLNVTNNLPQRQGNERLKERPNHIYFMKDAYKKYTYGINLNSSIASTNAKLHCNRAAINLKIKNYGKVIEDCKFALKYDPNYAKAYYRYACALYALKRYEECLAIMKDRKEPEFDELRKKVLVAQEKYRKEREEKESAASYFELRVRNYCSEHGYRIKKRKEPLPNGVKLKFVEDRLCVPLLIMYPEFSQFDMVEHTFYEDLLSTHVHEVTKDGLPWDVEHHYTANNMETYVEVEEGVMLHLTANTHIGDLLKKCINLEAVEVTLVSTVNKHYQQFRQHYKIVND